MASAIIALGRASIEIDSLETEARLVFIPDSKGDGWDASAINKLAFDKNIRSQPEPKALETFLSKAAKAKTEDPMEMIYCRGLPPEAPQDEKITWEFLPVPDDIEPFKEEVIANAPPPEIIRVHTEKIKHERKIKKAGALPFMPAKEEAEVTWEKKERREAVDVNPEAKEIKYAASGTKLGTLSHSVPGKPGKSIFGRPIPPALPQNEACLLGNGIIKDKNDLIANFSGFLRLGENWADMIPFANHSYTITTGIDGLTLFLNFQSGDSRFEAPKGGDILAAAKAKGASPESLVTAKELDAAIARSIKANESLDAFALCRTQEAYAGVEINPERTRAALNLRKGLAGALPLEIKAIVQALKDSGVKVSDSEKLKADIKLFLEGKELALVDYVLAEGKPSTRGEDRMIETLASMLSDDEKKPIYTRLNEWKERDSLKTIGFDFLKARGAAFVEEDTVVARIGEPSQGEDGKDIYGNIISGLPGNDPDLQLIRGLALQGQEIKTIKSGLLLVEGSEKSFHAMVIDYQDARIGIHISDDAMETRGDFFKEEGAGVPLTLENVKKVLAALGVKKGINWEGLEKACSLARANGNVMGHVLARGKAPLAKGGPAITWLVPLDMPEIPGAETAVQIKAGKAIVELSEPIAEGQAGYDVKGNEIPIGDGDPVVIEHDDSIKEAPCGKGKRFVALRSGELKFDGKRLAISSMNTVEGDAKGNIKFSGEIVIPGNVLPGCAIIGGSHVTVEGMAHEAFISAGGKIVMTGFKGNNKGILRARAGIEAVFVERASVMAVGNITLKKGSIQSMIKTNGKIFITADDGKLTGGTCQARNGVDTADIGSAKGTRTEISFGQDYLVKDQIGACGDEMEKTKRLLAETDGKIQDLVKKNIPLPDEIKNEKMRLVKILEQGKLKLFALSEKFEEHCESEIRCRGTIFPGVVFESHNRYYEIMQKRSAVVIYFDRASGSIKERSID